MDPAKKIHPLIEKTLGQVLDQAIENHPDNDAVIYADRDLRLTYRQFGERVDRLAKGLLAMGVQKGEKVAIWATNVPDWLVLMFASAKIGSILVTVNTAYRSAELDYLLRQSETENLFLIDGYKDIDYLLTVYELIPELKRGQRESFKSERYPHLKRVVFLGPEKHRGMYSMPEILSMAALTTNETYEKAKSAVNCHDVVNMQYTSGTTGFPKGVMLTHYNIVNNGFWIGEHQKLSYKDRACLPVPLFHCFGCVLGIMAIITHAATTVFVELYDPVAVMISVEEERCTAVYGVPTMFIGILEHKLFPKFDFSSLRTGIMAGSTCPVSVMTQVMEKMNAREITICYGLTEASPVLTQTRADDDLRRKTETIGRPMPYIDVKIVDPETGETLPPETTGEICCKGYNIMKGYYNNEEATAQVIDKDGWLHSGDLGVMDEDGYLSITGRLKDMIIRGGENVYPREVEEFIYTMEGISDVQVVGVPSRKYGEEVGAFVILKEGHEISPDDIALACRGRISRYKIPKYIAIIDEFPLTASGKIQKYKLRELAAEMWPDA